MICQNFHFEGGKGVCLCCRSSDIDKLIFDGDALSNLITPLNICASPLSVPQGLKWDVYYTNGIQGNAVS